MVLETLQKHHRQFFVYVQMGTYIHLNELHYSNNRYWRKNQVRLDSCYFHKIGCCDIHHGNHSPLHLLHKDLLLYKNVHLQQMVENSSRHQNQNQVRLDNYLIYILDHPGTPHGNHNLLHFLNKSDSYRIQYLH